MKLKHLFLVMIVCLALSAVTWAQDAPEATAEATVEAPPVEVTTEPTVETPTVEPTVEVTTEPTVEAPPVEVTTEPTVEATDEVPPEVTQEPTLEVPPVVIAPEPAIALLFADNFESGDYTPWVGGIGWITLPGQMQAIDSNEPLTLVKGVYFNAVAMARLKFTSGSGQVSVRSSDPLGYTAAVDTVGNVTLSRAGAVVQTAVATLSGEWTDIRLSAIGSVIRVAVNGNEVIAWNDDAPLPPGSVTISANFAPRTDPNAPSDTLTVEDFALFVPVEELPPPTVEPTAEVIVEAPVVEVTEEATEVPVIEVTAEPTVDVSSETVISALLGGPVLNKPDDGSFVNTSRPTLSWKKVAGANRYRVDINTQEDFLGTAILDNKETTALSLALSAANLPTALQQGQYFWRVQAREASTLQWGDESLIRDFIVDLAKTPSEGQVITAATTARPKFQWSTASISGATYVVQIDDDPQFASPISVPVVPTKNLSYTLTAAEALPHGNYYWRVVVNGAAPDPTLNIRNSFTVSPAAASVKLKTPTNNLVTYNNTWGFDWDPTTSTAGGPFDYQIQINTVNNFNGSVLIDETDSLDNYDTLAPLDDGVYWWRVRPVNQFGVGKWSTAWKFTIDRVAKPKSPLACTTNARPTFTWDGVPGATQYKLLVDNNNDFSSPEINVMRSKTQLSYPTPAVSALGQAIYYWRVDFSFDAAPGPYLNFVTGPLVEDFCVTPKPLKAPTLASPPNNTSINDTTLPNLIWNAVTDANDVDYRIQVATNANFPASSIIVDQIVEDANFDDATARNNGNYWWRVKSVNYLGAESTSWSSKWKFTLDTISPTTAPAISSPSCGSTTFTNRPTFKWGAVSTAVKYHIQYDTHNPPTSMPYVTTARQYQPPAQLLYTTWYWRVRGVDAANNFGPWSDTVTQCSIIVKSANGIAPVPNRYTDNTPTLTWTPISWAVTYTIEIYKSPTVSAANLVATFPNLPNTSTSYEVSPLDNGTYYWRVRAVGPSGPGNWSGPGLGIFQVEAP